MCEPYIHPLQLPSVKTVGEGRAIILHGGKMLDRYERGSNLTRFILLIQAVIHIFSKGKPWISLVPNNFLPSFNN